MRKITFILATLLLTLLPGTGAFAADVVADSPWVGEAIENGQTYYLYNPKAKAFMKGANAWGTRASFGQDAVAFMAEGSGDTYALKSTYGSYLGADLYVDQAKLDFVFNEVSSGVYSFTKDGRYIAYTGENTVMYSDVLTDGCYWQLLTRESILRDMASAGAAKAYDVTALIPGANFGRNDQATGSWNGGPVLNGVNENFCAEKWGAAAFDVNQTLTGLPNGTYKLQVQGLFRVGGGGNNATLAAEQYAAGNPALNAVFYGNSSEMPLMSVIEEAKDGTAPNYGDYFSTTFGYVPQSQLGASNFFNEGLYEHSLYVTVTDGTLKMGVKKSIELGNDWVVFDNFRLAYYGTATVDEINKVHFNEVRYELEKLTETCTSLSALGEVFNAYMEVADQAWNIANDVDATIEEINAYIPVMEAKLAEVKTIDEYFNNVFSPLNNLCYEIQENSTPDSEEVYYAFEEECAKAGFMNLYSGVRTVADLEALVEVLDNARRAYVVNAQPAEGYAFDYTFLVTNPDMEDNTINGWTTTSGWQFQGAKYVNGDITISRFQETWVPSSSSLGTTSSQQTLSNIPNGVYKVSVDIIATAQGTTPNDAVVNAWWETGDKLVPIATANEKPEHYEVETIVYDNTLTIGVETDSTNANWMAFDNVKVSYQGKGWEFEDGHLIVKADIDLTPSTNYPWNSLRSQITSVTIKEGVTMVGTSAFYNCRNLINVELPNSLTYIGNDAFMQCSSLTAISIPQSVTYLGQFAFHGCENLESVVLSDNLSIIGTNTFYGCYNLKTIEIPDNVTSIANGAFMSCSSLESIAWGEGLIELGNAAFQYCTELSAITLPEGVVTLGYNLFDGCTGLTSISVPSSVEIIRNSAFYNCHNLTSVVFSENSRLDMIGWAAFSNCNSLSSITIPENVTWIDGYAFEGCVSLTDVTSLAAVAPALGRGVFLNIPYNVALNTPVGSDYSSWMEYFSGEVFYLKNVGTGAFLQAGNAWGTQASSGTRGLDVKITELPNGKYRIATNMYGGNSQLGLGEGDLSNVYTDGIANEWTMEQQPNGFYTLTLDSVNYLGCEDNDIVGLTLTDPAAPNAQWQLVTKEERVAAMADANGSALVDATFLLPGATFGRNDVRNLLWADYPTAGGYFSTTESNFCAEKWNEETFDVYQEITVPNGYYHVTAQGFYRMGDASNSATTAAEHHLAGTETLNALLYANEKEVPLMSIIEGAQETALTHGAYDETAFGYVPRDIQSAADFFEAGLYEHSLWVHVTNGTLRIGVKKNAGDAKDWTAFDNFNLTYYGADLSANEVDGLANGTFGDADMASLEGWINEGGEVTKNKHNKWTNFNDGFAEKWVEYDSTLVDFEFYQEVKGLPAGDYIFAIAAIACQQGNSDDYKVSGVNIYANDESMAVHTINVDRNLGNQAIGGEDIFIPVSLAEGETLRIGVSVKNTDANWVAIDNARLYCFDEDVLMEAAIRYANRLIEENPAVNGMTLAVLKNEMAAADDLSALRVATAEFEFAIPSYNHLEAMVVEYEGVEQLATAIATAKPVLLSTTATLAEVDEAYVVLEEAVFQYRFAVASLTYPCDITSRYVVNPRMEEETLGWTTNMKPDPKENLVNAYFNGNAYLKEFLEMWQPNYAVGEVYASQDITGLPSGIYRLGADIIATRQNVEDSKGEAKGVHLFIDSDSVAVATEDGKPERFEVYADVKGNSLTIGIAGTEVTANWVAWDNITLEYLGGYTPGDVNCDDKHTMNDVVMTVNAVLEKPSAKLHPYAADVNDDDVIAMGDVVNILQMVLTDGVDVESFARARVAAYDSKLAFASSEASLTTGLDCVVPVALNNTGAYSAFQVDVELPDGVELVDVQLSDRAQDTHTVAWNTLSNGMIRIVAYAADNAAFTGNDGDLINLVVKADATLADDAAMTLAKGMFVTVKGAEHTVANARVALRNGTTAIENVDGNSQMVYGIHNAIVIEAAEAAVVDIFAVNGKLVQTVSLTIGKNVINMPAGIYVVNKNKVTVK